MATSHEHLIRGTGALGRLRASLGLSQHRAAELAGISRGHLTNLEAGRHDRVTIETAHRIARGWGVEVAKVLDALRLSRRRKVRSAA